MISPTPTSIPKQGQVVSVRQRPTHLVRHVLTAETTCPQKPDLPIVPKAHNLWHQGKRQSL